MRGYRPSGESDLDYDVEEEGYRPRPKRPAPGKVSRTMRMDGQVIARRSTGDGDPVDTSGVTGLIDRTAGGGQALPESLRGSFEESLGVRLADVRVHDDRESADVARSISAKAFTVGQDIYFGAGQYDPHSEGGKHLIAHEVAHTAQQAAGGTHVHTKLEVSQAGDAIENEADAAADAMVAGQRATVSAAPMAAARTPDGTAAPAGAADANAGASARADKPNTVTVTITPKAGKMEFDAETYLDLYKQIADRAAGNKCCGQCICAADLDTTAIDKYQIKVTVSLEKQVPSWKQIAKQPKEHQDKFNAWAASVKTHEDTHYKKYEDAYNSLKTKLVPCADDAAASKIFKEVDDAVEKDQKAFDDNKANQPAPLPIPGGVEKIDSTPGAKKSATDDEGAAEAGPVARKATREGEAVDTSGVNGLVQRTRGRGDALPDSLRGSFEQSLGAQLGGVRVHTDRESADVARSIAAKAFTVGQDIYFGAGQYDPGSEGGQHLIAHEVAHTAQQAQGGTHVHTKLEVSSAGDSIENEADAAADAMMAGHKASVSAAPTSAARTPDGAAPAGPAGASDPNAGATQQGGGATTKTTVKVKVNPKSSAVMEFDAADYNALYQQVSARANTNKCAGFCECGTAQCNYVTWDPGDGGKVTAKELSIEVDITTSSPTWKQIASQPKADQDKFNAWATSVAAHEKLHYDTYKKGFDGMKTSIIGPTETDCDTQYKTARDAIDPLQDAIDANQQPAPLAAPGGMIKVPSSGVPAKPNATDDESAAAPADAPVQRKAIRAIAPAEDVGARLTRGGGRPLPGAARERLEAGLGVDLGGVRVHTDAAAAANADALAARAFASEQDVYFAAGEYDPDGAGFRLLAHEVVHTVQQRGGGALAAKGRISQPDDVAEVEADAIADRIAGGATATVTVTASPAPLSRKGRTAKDLGYPETSDPWMLQQAQRNVAKPTPGWIGGAKSVTHGDMLGLGYEYRGVSGNWRRYHLPNTDPGMIFNILINPEEDPDAPDPNDPTTEKQGDPPELVEAKRMIQEWSRLTKQTLPLYDRLRVLRSQGKGNTPEYDDLIRKTNDLFDQAKEWETEYQDALPEWREGLADKPDALSQLDNMSTGDVGSLRSWVDDFDNNRAAGDNQKADDEWKEKEKALQKLKEELENPPPEETPDDQGGDEGGTGGDDDAPESDEESDAE